MSLRREYASLLAQQQQQKKSKDGAGNIDLHEAYPGDTALLERWEKLLRSANGMVDRRAPDGMDDAFHGENVFGEGGLFDIEMILLVYGVFSSAACLAALVTLCCFSVSNINIFEGI